MEDRVKRIMSAVFNIGVNSIDNESSSNNIDDWDSLKHMNLIVALEEEFNIEFNDEEVTNSMSYALIIEILNGK